MSICIVNWNTRDYLHACLRSIEQAPDAISREVIVVDNASGDGSAEMVRRQHPEVLLLAASENLGFAAGNNLALRKARGRLLLVLNPDVQVHPGALDALADVLERHPRAGAAAPRLILPDGRIQASCRTFPTPEVICYELLGLSRLFPRSRRFGKYRMTWWNYADERTVDQPMASALLLRRAALDEVGLFDESFPIFFNDVDLSKRLWEAGWETWYTPRATMSHVGGASTAQVRVPMIIESQRSLLRFYEKHYRATLPAWQYYLTTTSLRCAGAVRVALTRMQLCAANLSRCRTR